MANFYYQPWMHVDAGIPGSCVTYPEGLHSFQCFQSRKEANAWLREHGFNLKAFTVKKFVDDGTEGMTLIDRYGNTLEVSDAIHERLDDIEDSCANEYYHLPDPPATFSRVWKEYTENALTSFDPKCDELAEYLDRLDKYDFIDWLC